MKLFDWQLCFALHKVEWAGWLQTNYDKPVTEVQYMAAYRAMRGEDVRSHKARRYATAKLRKSYKNLQEDFGFFAQHPIIADDGSLSYSSRG
jgi:hypothetical protein